MTPGSAIPAQKTVHEPITSSLVGVLTRCVNRFRRARLLWELDSSRKHCAVLGQQIDNDLVAIRHFPLHKKQITAQLRVNIAIFDREIELQKALNFTLRGLN